MVHNSGTISDGTFQGEVKNKGSITGGSFSGTVVNYGTITNENTTTITGGYIEVGEGTIEGVNVNSTQQAYPISYSISGVVDIDMGSFNYYIVGEGMTLPTGKDLEDSGYTPTGTTSEYFDGWYSHTDKWEIDYENGPITKILAGEEKAYQLYGRWKFPLTVENGTESGYYASDSTVTVTADDAPEGHEFVKWESDDVIFADESSETTTFTMSNWAVTVTATYSDHSYTEETVKDEAFKSSAGCTASAVYYKSCACGAISTSDADTFTSGSTSGHTWDEGAVTKKATAIEKGEKIYTCNVCKETRAEEISALGIPVKGTKVTDDSGKATYKVTKSGEKGGTVEYTKSADAKAKSITIPATVKIDGITYKVTSIAEKAFKNNTKITTITIGSNVKRVIP